MADAINTFDASTQDAASCGFVQPIKGEGYALTHDPVTNKWRADVWDDEGRHRASPFLGDMTAESAKLMGLKLVWDFDQWDDVRAQVAAISEGRMDAVVPPLRERSEVGYARAVKLRDAMLALYG